MPKKIENVREKILNNAIDMFIKDSYENVDIRTIAKNSGIAVGTFYNYFPNKKKLFREVVNESWKDTLYKLNKIVISDDNIDNKINNFINKYYDDIEARKGIGRKLMRIEIIDLNEKDFIDKSYSFFDNIKNKVINLIRDLIIQKYCYLDNCNQEDIEDLAESIYILMSGYCYAKKEKGVYIEHILNIMESYVSHNFLTK